MSAIPSGPRPKHLTIGRIGMYCFILTCALFFFNAVICNDYHILKRYG